MDGPAEHSGRQVGYHSRWRGSGHRGRVDLGLEEGDVDLRHGGLCGGLLGVHQSGRCEWLRAQLDPCRMLIRDRSHLRRHDI